MAKITSCLWSDHGKAREASEVHATVFPDRHVGPVLDSPADNPSIGRGEEITVEFTVLGRSPVGLHGGSKFTCDEAVSFQVFTEDRKEIARCWIAIVGNGGAESMCSWSKDRWGFSSQVVPSASMAGMADPDSAIAKEATEAMMKKIDIAAIIAARAGETTHA